MFNTPGDANHSETSSRMPVNRQKGCWNREVEKTRHEFRSSLNVIIGYAELMLDGAMGKMTEEQIIGIKDILNKSRHLAQMVNDLTGR